MKKVLLILLCFVAFSNASSVCLSRTLQYCQTSFNQHLNVTSDTSDWTNPGTLSYILRSYYVKSFDAFITVCSARQNFAQCLGDQYDSCISEMNFIASGESRENARDYVQIFKTLEFDCNGGFIQASRNWPCIAAVFQNGDAALTKCQQTYYQNLEKDACYAANTFETCIQKLFSVHCGIEASWWSCERTRRGYSIDQSCPKAVCSSTLPGSSASLQGSNTFRVFNHVSKYSKFLQNLAKH